MRNGITKYIQLHTDRYEKIYGAKNGQEALDFIFRYRPDIMLLDVQMPVMNGIEVMQAAHRGGILPNTIILSGYDEFRYAQQAVRFGAREYMLKPSRSSDILKKINELADDVFGPENEEPPVIIQKNQLVELAKEYMDEHYFENLSLNDIAGKIGISPAYLSSLFSQQAGITLIDYLNEGVTTRNHKASLKERYNIMVKYYGRIPVMFLHLWFALRFYTAKWIKGRV